ncbi:MAG: hypothetical protein OXC62_16550 [Aestuariivita sp.]|nr:hypothetical protein [Aestuariivita sp.]
MNISDKGKARETGQALNVHYRFIVWLIPTLMNFPRTQKFLLGDKIQTTAMDVLEALIEATYTKHREASLVRANLGLEKLRFFLRISRDSGRLKKYRHRPNVTACAIKFMITTCRGGHATLILQ